ncbi:hypothetical protein OPW39_15635 [Vibrio europaeus]|uniref:hypothetical protein n=1 Tax=Vibrio europaeus TaxID=300876 RepID=UPI00233EB047|nr:hypothetical protein [Vibrio europaeus]MDC5870239.1 hypothetical protein [Vibrio europaeus]
MKEIKRFLLEDVKFKKGANLGAYGRCKRIGFSRNERIKQAGQQGLESLIVRTAVRSKQ